MTGATRALKWTVETRAHSYQPFGSVPTDPSGYRLSAGRMRAFMDQHVNRWVEENNETRTVRAITVAAPKYA